VSSFGAGLDHDFIVPESGVIICKDEAIKFGNNILDAQLRAAYPFAMWLHHMFNLLANAASVFVEAIGTTWLGLGLAILFGLSTAGATAYRIYQQHGWEAMLDHWRDDAKIALRISGICAALIYVPIVFWSVGKAIYVDHQYLVSFGRQQSKTIKQNGSAFDGIRTNMEGQIVGWRTKCAGFEAANGVMTNQNRDQQNTINRCQEDALKLLTPAIQKTTGIPLEQTDGGTDKDGRGLVKAHFLLLTNKEVSPVDMDVSCDAQISSVNVYPVPVVTHGGSQNRINDSNWEARVGFPWTAEAPLMAEVIYYGTHGVKSTTVCRFNLR
jgi:hypothetical protein